jgi:hypothetical protein
MMRVTPFLSWPNQGTRIALNFEAQGNNPP